MQNPARARRLLSRLWPCCARRALGVLCFLAMVVPLVRPVGATPPDVIVKAEFVEPTTRYGHDVLGEGGEWGALLLTVDRCHLCTGEADLYNLIIRLPETHVFEDIAPRLITGDDGPTLVMVVESSVTEGARLSLYDERGLYAATPFIGRRNRWLAPIGVADLDGDGWPEIAYVDRPHLAKILRIWRLKDGGLHPVDSQPGLSNHQIGQGFITSGIRRCEGRPEIVTPSADWRQVMALQLVGNQIRLRSLGPMEGVEDVAQALRCQTD